MPFRLTLLVTLGLPTAALADQTSWHTFNDDLAATKFADVQSFNPGNVADLERAWEVHTSDVSDGSGDLPETVWSATPIYANNTLYLGTPFYRIFALEPLTQPALKTRGVAYWESGQAGVCEKRVFLGTMDAELHAVDADTGALCTDFADGGVLNLNQYNTVNARFPFSILQPPTVVGDALMVGWAGKDRAYAVAPPGNLMAIDARSGALKWDLGFIFVLNRETGARLYEVLFGRSQQWGFYGLATWGSPTLGGPVVTAGGVEFIGASMDARVRALDAATGAERWSDLVEAPSVAIPAVYTHEGVDYVVFTAGGNSILKSQVSDQLVAYRLGTRK